MDIDNRITFGLIGTALSATGTSMSMNEVQTIVSIIITIAGFIIGVLIPGIIKLVKLIKDAKSDGVITKDEKSEIKDELVDLIDKILDETKKLTSESKNDVESSSDENK